MTVHRAELRARYPAILESASLSYGPGWAGLMEALCERLQFHTDNNTMPPVQITQAKEGIRIWLCLKAHSRPDSSSSISVFMSAP